MTSIEPVKAHRQLIVVNGILENRDTFLIVRRRAKIKLWDKKWGFPGGKIDPGESILEALHREIREETGLTIHSPELLGIYTHHWDHPDFIQQTFVTIYRCQTNQPTAISLDLKENDQFQWVTVEQFLKLPDQLDGNREIMEQLYLPYVRHTS